MFYISDSPQSKAETPQEPTVLLATKNRDPATAALRFTDEVNGATGAKSATATAMFEKGVPPSVQTSKATSLLSEMIRSSMVETEGDMDTAMPSSASQAAAARDRRKKRLQQNHQPQPHHHHHHHGGHHGQGAATATAAAGSAVSSTASSSAAVTKLKQQQHQQQALRFPTQTAQQPQPQQPRPHHQHQEVKPQQQPQQQVLDEVSSESVRRTLRNEWDPRQQAVGASGKAALSDATAFQFSFRSACNGW